MGRPEPLSYKFKIFFINLVNEKILTILLGEKKFNQPYIKVIFL